MIAIRDIILQNPIAIAPMSGVSDLPFRRVAAKMGAGLVFSEMVASDELARARPDVVRRASGDGSIFPFAIQLAGRDAYWMARGAYLAEEAGADIIDINMGCPSRQVTGQLSGSALMRDLDHAELLIKAVINATSKPVTLKMRLGWDYRSLNAPELAQRAEACGVQLITVHGRTRNDFYKGQANWSAVGAVVDAVNIPVLVNGDIRNIETARTALRQSRANGIMIGRASIGQPWLGGVLAGALFQGSNIEPPDLVTQGNIVLAHYREIIAHYGTRLGVRIARKHIAAYIDNAPLSITDRQRHDIRRSICCESDPKAVSTALTQLYRKKIVTFPACAA